LPFFEGKPAVGAGLGIGRQILSTFRAGKGEFSAAVWADHLIFFQRVAAVRAEVHATGGAFLVSLFDGRATIGAELGELDFGEFNLRFSLILKAVGEFGATVRAHSSVCGDLLVADRAVETEFGATMWAYRFFDVHLAPTLRAFYHVDVLVIAG
jgi:hypothetical protein